MLAVAWPPRPSAERRHPAVPRAGRNLEPAGRGAGRRRSGHRRARGDRALVGRGRHRPVDRLVDGQHPLSDPGWHRGRNADLPLRAPRHGSPGRAARARDRGRDRAECGRNHPRCGRQGRRGCHARGRSACRRGGAAACGDRVALHAEGGGRPRRRVRVRPHAARSPHRVRLRPGCADRRDHPRRSDAEFDPGAVSRTGGPCGHVSRGRALCDLRSGPGCRRHAARPDRPTSRARTSA